MPEARIFDDVSGPVLMSSVADGYWSIEISYADDSGDIYTEQPTLERITKVLQKYSGYNKVEIIWHKFRDPANC